MTQVFVDTVGLLALWDQADQWNVAAQAAWSAVLTSSSIAYTTTFVLAECGNAAARKPYRGAVDRIRLQFEHAHRLIRPTESDWAVAWNNFQKRKSGAPGIVDQISFVVMRRLGITDVFTNDRHFKAAGFNTLF